MPTSVFVQQPIMPFVPFTPVMPYQFSFMNVFQNAFQNIWNLRQTAPQQPFSFLNLTKNNSVRTINTEKTVKPIASTPIRKTTSVVSTPKKKATKVSEDKQVKPQTTCQKTTAKVSGQNLPTLSEVDYNEQKANRLVQDAMSHRRTTPLRKGETGRCAAYVKESIQRTGLGEYISGHAYQCGDIMAQNSNFQEIKVAANDLKNLPAGCVVVYPQNDVYSRAYGHILITRGDGSSISQFASDTTKASDRARVFVPV